MKECQWMFLQRGLEKEGKGVSQRVQNALGGLGRCRANVRSAKVHEPRRRIEELEGFDWTEAEGVADNSMMCLMASLLLDSV